MNNYSFKNDRDSIDFVIEQLSHNPKLNDWEKGFIKNIKEVHKRSFLSDKQLEKLSDLWEKY